MGTKRAIRKLLLRTRSRRVAACALSVTVAFLLVAQAVSSQESRSKEQNQQARVPTSYANVHEAPGSGSALLVIIPRDTVLPIIGRRGEFVQVQLSPELRKTGIVIRWYEGKREIIRRGQRITIGDEDSGWMHDSTVEITEVTAPE